MLSSGLSASYELRPPKGAANLGVACKCFRTRKGRSLRTLPADGASCEMHLLSKKAVGSAALRNTASRKILFHPADARYSLADLPTLMQLEQAVHSMSDGKAPGPSGIGPAPWKAHPALSARALLPMCLKSHVRLCEPVQNRGTIVIGPQESSVHRVPESFGQNLPQGSPTCSGRGTRPSRHASTASLPARIFFRGPAPLCGYQSTHCPSSQALLDVLPAALDEVREYVSGTTMDPGSIMRVTAR